MLASLAAVEGTAAPVAGNPSCPPEVFEDIAANGDRAARATAVANPSCPPEVIAALLDGDPNFDLAAAGNPSCPADVLAGLAVDGREDYVRCAALSNPGCPPETLEAAALDDPDAATAVLWNPSAPMGLLDRLSDHENPHVASAARIARAQRNHRESRGQDPDGG